MTSSKHIKLLSRLKWVAILALLGISFFLIYKYFHQTTDSESIRSYDVVLNVQNNNNLIVTETIVYDFGYNRKKGISRYFPLVSSGANRLNVTVLSIVDEFGTSYKYEASVINDVLRIETGNADDLIKGVHTFVISYEVENAISIGDNFNEIYWNVAGDKWPVIIGHSAATIILPRKVRIININCFTGPTGSTDSNCTKSVSESGETTIVFFATTRPLEIIEGFTIFLDFQ